MTVTRTQIRVEFRGMVTSETLSDATLDVFINRAVRFYSRFNPVEKSATITTVSGTQDYDLAADCMILKDVEYWPSGNAFDLTNIGDYPPYFMWARPTSQSDQVIRNIQKSTYADTLRGGWEQINQKARLWPTPTCVDTITYYYWSEHVEAAESFATIPSWDLGILVDLTMAEYLEHKLGESSMLPNYTLGLESRTNQFVTPNLSMNIARLRRSVIDKYGGEPCSL